MLNSVPMPSIVYYLKSWITRCPAYFWTLISAPIKPIEIDLSGGVHVEVIRKSSPVFGILLLLFVSPLIWLLFNDIMNNPTGWSFPRIVMTTIEVLLSIIVVNAFLKAAFFDYRIAYYPDHLVIMRHSWFAGMHTQEILYQDYQSIRLFERTIAVGRWRRVFYYTYQIIELVHEDNRLTVPLYFSRHGKMPIKLFRDYAKFLHLPAFEDDGDGFVEVDPDEIGMALAQRSKQAVRAFGHQSEIAAIPTDLVIENKDVFGRNQTEITLQKTFRNLLPILAGYFVVMIGMVSSFTEEKVSFDAVFIWLVILLVMSYFTWLYMKSEQKITISENDLLVERTLWEKTATRMSLNEIVSIQLRDQDLGHVLEIEDKECSAKIGFEASEKTLLWLKKYLTSVVMER